jgi:hypothetical protein
MIASTETRQIPQLLTERDQWITYRLEERAGKRTKVPYQARNSGAKASSTDPCTWAPFAVVRESERIGYVLTAADGVAFIDLDHCVDPETREIDGWAAAYVEEADTFTEFSQSGAGLHILAGGSLPGTGRHRKDEAGNPVEMYDRERFIAITGDRVPGTPATIEPRQAFIDALYAQLADPPKRETPAHEPLTCSDAEIVTKACANTTTGAEFTRLFAGDLSDVDGNASRGDWKLIRSLRFWTRADAGRMDAIYRSSGLRRDKWDSRRGDSTYGARTIAAALDKGGPLYDTGRAILDGIRRNGHTSGAAAPDAAGIEDDHEGAALPLLDAGDRQLPRIAAQSWSAIGRYNSGPHLFRYGDVPTRIEAGGDGQPLLRAVTPDTLRFELARAATWFVDVPPAKDRPSRRMDAAPPMGLVRDLLATPEPPLPVLRRLTTAPVFARDFTLRTERGFHDGIYFTGGLTVPPIPERPTPAEIAAARGVLYELLIDFPFAQPSDKAHACAMCLQAFVRDLITGPTPLHLISAPAEGTGKGLLADALCIVALGQHAAIMTEGRDADDWRKRVTSYLLMGHQAIQLDNLSRKLDAGSVAAALTSTTWTDRILGGSTTARLPNTALWIATANNPNLSTEIARRCVRIRIDARSAHPNRRPASEFQHPDLRRWAHAHRPELVAACLTLIQAWIAAGRPVPTPTLGSFESWAEVIGGVLHVAGIDGFLDNSDEFFDQADTDGNGWRAFVAEWWHLFEDKAVSVADLYPLYNGSDIIQKLNAPPVLYPGSDFGLDFGGADDKARRVRLGRAIGQQRDKVYDSWRITHAGMKKGAVQYRLEEVRHG